MDTKKKFEHGTDGSQTRLAESSIAAIDGCECGMMQLHIGAMTLRLSPCAASELLRTLGTAVAAHSERFQSEHALSEAHNSRRRCDA